MSMPEFFYIAPMEPGSPRIIINPDQIASVTSYRFKEYMTWELIMSNGMHYETRTNVEAIIFAPEPIAVPKAEPVPAPKAVEPVKVQEPTSQLARLEDKKPEVTKKPEIIDVSKDAPEANMGRVVVQRRRRSVA